MSRVPAQEPTIDERGDERHPAFALIGASRVSSNPGAKLFDSDVQHANSVVIRLKAASRKRDLATDWLHGDFTPYFEVQLSEAQWASFVSTMNSGDGVPCTLRYKDGEEIPGIVDPPRLALSMAETHDAADRAFRQIQEAMEAYYSLDSKTPAKERRLALDYLRSAIRNATANVDFAGKQLVEHTENVVTKARADVEAFVSAKVAQLGLEAAALGEVNVFELGSGD